MNRTFLKMAAKIIQLHFLISSELGERANNMLYVVHKEQVRTSNKMFVCSTHRTRKEKRRNGDQQDKVRECARNDKVRERETTKRVCERMCEKRHRACARNDKVRENAR